MSTITVTEKAADKWKEWWAKVHDRDKQRKENLFYFGCHGNDL